jgi:RNA polymerase sigma-70 factor (ECF subfamily)
VDRTLPTELAPDSIDLMNVLATLPSAQREVVVLHHLADLPVTDIAAALGLSVGTVKSRLSRARLALAHALDEEHHA